MIFVNKKLVSIFLGCMAGFVSLSYAQTVPSDATIDLNRLRTNVREAITVSLFYTDVPYENIQFIDNNGVHRRMVDYLRVNGIWWGRHRQGSPNDLRRFVAPTKGITMAELIKTVTKIVVPEVYGRDSRVYTMIQQAQRPHGYIEVADALGMLDLLPYTKEQLRNDHLLATQMDILYLVRFAGVLLDDSAVASYTYTGGNILQLREVFAREASFLFGKYMPTQTDPDTFLFLVTLSSIIEGDISQERATRIGHNLIRYIDRQNTRFDGPYMRGIIADAFGVRVSTEGSVGTHSSAGTTNTQNEGTVGNNTSTNTQTEGSVESGTSTNTQTEGTIGGNTSTNTQTEGTVGSNTSTNTSNTSTNDGLIGED